MKFRNIALFDLDGTLANYHNKLHKDLKEICAPVENVPNDLWIEENYWKKRIDLIRNQIGWWQSLEKLENGFKLLKMCYELDFEIHILSKCPVASKNSWTEKFKWCEENLLQDYPKIKVTLTQDKSLTYGNLLVDDYPEFMDGWLKYRPRGLGIMPVHNHNEGYSNPNVIKYDGNNDEEIMKALQYSATRKIQ
jgi:FMN phosphatase YigB (HAD superfamily)